jgi:hypothetical protein
LEERMSVTPRLPEGHHVRELALDATTAEVVGALSTAGIRSILIKGLAIAQRLYDDPAERPYDDIDLLVDPRQFAAAEQALEELGFRTESTGARQAERPEHATMWHRQQPIPAQLDLHRTLHWCTSSPEKLWSEFSARTRSVEILGTPVLLLADPAQAVVVGMHVLQHGTFPKPRQDLSRALERFDEEVWVQAAQLAAELGAANAFQAGLRSVPGGSELLRRLPVVRAAPASVEMRIRAADAPACSVGFLRLSSAGSTPGRLRFLASELFPSPSFMRAWSLFARRGPGPLFLSYLYRPVVLAAAAPRGWRTYRRAVRESERERAVA